MKINSLQFLSPINQVKPQRFQSFCARKPLCTDVFVSSAISVNYEDEKVRGSHVKDITLKDKKGKDVPAFIIQNNNDYYVCTGNTAHCRMQLKDADEFAFVSQLYGEDNKGKYKGAGTELIKLAVEQSRKNGHGGVVKLFMAGSQNFYYKNNFRLTEEDTNDYLEGNAILDYAARTGKYCSRISGMPSFAPLMVLDKKGADALMQGKRLMDESKSQTLYDKKISLPWEKLNTEVDYCDFGDEFVIQLMDKDCEDVRQIACLTGKNENGKLVSYGIDDRFDDYKDEEAVQDALYEALDYTQKSIFGKTMN